MKLRIKKKQAPLRLHPAAEGDFVRTSGSGYTHRANAPVEALEAEAEALSAEERPGFYLGDWRQVRPEWRSRAALIEQARSLGAKDEQVFAITLKNVRKLIEELTASDTPAPISKRKPLIVRIPKNRM